jgi:hypothetical protein
MPRYKVMVDDNFHYQEDDRRQHGTYETLEQATAACRSMSINRLPRNTIPA